MKQKRLIIESRLLEVTSTSPTSFVVVEIQEDPFRPCEDGTRMGRRLFKQLCEETASKLKGSPW